MWSRVEEADDLWGGEAREAHGAWKGLGEVEDFRKEALTYFLSGVGLQELYVQAAHILYTLLPAPLSHFRPAFLPLKMPSAEK